MSGMSNELYVQAGLERRNSHSQKHAISQDIVAWWAWWAAACRSSTHKAYEARLQGCPCCLNINACKDLNGLAGIALECLMGQATVIFGCGMLCPQSDTVYDYPWM